MNKEIAKEWCDALRSGEYPQGLYCLFDDKDYCCLGVLCALAAKHGVIESFNGHDACLPKKVQEWAGMKSDIGTIPSGSLKFMSDSERFDLRPDYNLVCLNDNIRLTFNEIADVIERQVENL